MKFFHANDDLLLRNEDVYKNVKIDEFCIKSIEILEYSDDEVISKCGIVFLNKKGEEIIVAAGVSPGSVSAKIPEHESEFEPELEYNLYTRKQVQSE